MERNNLPGLTPIAIILLAVVLGIFLSISVPLFIGSAAIRPSDWIGFAGSVLTSGVAAIAAYLAWRNISRQMRANFLSREEDRIEEELPGLSDTEDRLAIMLSQFEAARHPVALGQLLLAHKIGVKRSSVADAVDLIFPRANRRTRRRLAELFFDININVVRCSIREQERTAAKADLSNISQFTAADHQKVRDAEKAACLGYDLQWAKVQEAVRGLKDFRENAVERIALLEDRLIRIRAEIERRIDN